MGWSPNPAHEVDTTVPDNPNSSTGRSEAMPDVSRVDEDAALIQGDEGLRSAGAPGVTDEPTDWRLLFRPAALGLIALVSIAVGVSLPNSPFKLDMPGTWFFGVPSVTPPANAPPADPFLGLVTVYGGLVLLGRVWYRLTVTLRTRPGVPVRYLWVVFALWVLPMLVVAPIFSRDVYSYAAQGEMMSRHINPYHYGPFTLGAGPYVNPVDPLWLNAPAPYGPLFLMLDGFFASASFHHVLGTVVLLRLAALGGVVLMGLCVPRLAHAYGKDPAALFALVVCNPLTLLSLVGSAHNDALMLGLLFAGITVAKRGHPVWGIVLCALATSVKVPAALGVVYIGWEWLGPNIPWRQRIRPLVTAGLLATAVIGVVTVISGLGWGWIANLGTPGTVRSWIAPTTGVAMGITGLLHLVGLQLGLHGILSVTRAIGFVVAAGVGLYLLINSDRFGGLWAMGLSLLAVVVLGPVVQPWYLTWGVVLLAPVAGRAMRKVLVGISVASPFIGLPGGRQLLVDLAHANPLAEAAALLALLAVWLVPVDRWSAWGRALTSHSYDGVSEEFSAHLVDG